MRFDAIGLFWQDVPRERKRGEVARVMPPIPDTGWEPPAEFPNLSRARVLSLDTETWDPELLDRGPGWARGKGHIVGVSIGADGGGRWYFPIRHEVEKEMNLDPDQVLRWLRDTLGNPRQPKVGANLMYDVGWLRHEGVEVAGQLYDVQYAEALVDERAAVGLEVLGQRYLGEGKDTNLLYQWCADYYGGAATDRQRANIYRAPPRLVGPYAESDADLPLRVLEAQWPLLSREGLLDLFHMECDLIRLLIEMRYAGVSVDVDRAEQLRETLRGEIKELEAELKRHVGFGVDVWANDSLARAFDTLGLPYNKTKTGRPSFTAGFLKGVKHPVGKLIRDVREREKLIGTFIESYILDSHVDGKLYGQFHPLRGDSTGTRSGRFSSSTPNLQNIPTRSKLGKEIRKLFIPDPGHERWRKYDYSQIEYRFLAHFAVGPKADHVRDVYRDNPRADFHRIAQQLVKEQTGIELERDGIKNINFGLVYGMGISTLAASLGLPLKKAKELFAAYHKGAPFVKATMEAAMDEAQRTGVVTTILGRKSRFDMWEPQRWNKDTVPMPYQEAVYAYGQVRRAYTHKALNRRLQGSAADLMKAAMLKCWKDGVFDRIGVPRLTVHDELDFSDPGGCEEGYAEMKHILETALELRVPVLVDEESGPNWGEVG